MTDLIAFLEVRKMSPQSFYLQGFVLTRVGRIVKISLPFTTLGSIGFPP